MCKAHTSCCQVAVHAYTTLLKELPSPYKGLEQELMDMDRAANQPLGLYDASSVFTGNAVKPVAGSSLGQCNAITAA